MVGPKVKLKDQLGRVVRLGGDSTGATIGKDLRWPDGSLIKSAEIRNPADAGGNGPAATVWKLIREVPANLQKLAKLSGIGFVTRDADGEWHQRSITAGEGVQVNDSDGVAGDPVVGLAELPDAGGGTLQKTARDSYGRVAGTSAATTDDLGEGSVNLYHTDSRAAAAAPVQSVNGKTGVLTLNASDVGGQPASANLAAWAAIVPAAKADDGAVVHKFGAETVTGSKTLTDVLRVQIGTPSPGMIVGADVFGTGITQNVRKLFRMALPSYNATATLPHIILSANTDGTPAATYVELGGAAGGATGVSAMSEIRFVTSSSYGAVGGDARWGINANTLFPYADNLYDIGSASNRPKQFWAGNGIINTSDAREKTPVRPLTPAELAAAAELATMIGSYRWLCMVEAKGEAARQHIGMTVQCAIAVLESHGLDPFAYGFICYDKWDELPEIRDEWEASPQVVDDFGNLVQEAQGAGFEIVQEHRPAGDRYSFRMDELLAFIAAGQQARISAIEGRLAALTAGRGNP